MDLGSSDGGTLRHISELRPDLRLASSDIAGSPSQYPSGTEFKRADFNTERLPWNDRTFDGITCMHVIEHLRTPSHLIEEAARVLKPGGLLYIETPHPKTVNLASAQGKGTEHITVNFFDDATHVAPVSSQELEAYCRVAGFSALKSGVSRNLLFAALYPVLLVLRPRTRARYVAQLHFTGWSIYTIAAKPMG